MPDIVNNNYILKIEILINRMLPSDWDQQFKQDMIM